MNRFLKIVALGFALLWVSTPAHAQQANNYWCNSATVPCPPSGWTPASAANPFPVTGTFTPSGSQATPLGKTTTEAKVTVSVTNTYQTALASAASRVGCTIQYIAIAGTKGFVFFGASPADTTTSFQLTNGQSITCAIGGTAVATDAVQVTGTGTDIFIVSNQ